MPVVTVVIPTRDRWTMVRSAARSALGQQGVDTAVVVVDDGSQELSPALGDLPVTMIRHERSTGVSRARNRGLEAVTTDWVAFLDDDDLWAPDHIARMLAAAGDAVLVCAGCVQIDDERRILGMRSAPPAGDIARALHSDNVIPTPSGVLVRTDAIRRVGGFDPAFSIVADWDMWLRLSEVGPIARVDALSVAYTIHAGNLHADPDRLLREVGLIRRRHGAAAASIGVPLPGPDFSAYVAGAMRRRGRRREAARWYLRSARRRGQGLDVVRAAGALVAPAAARIPRSGRRAAAHPAAAWIGALDV